MAVQLQRRIFTVDEYHHMIKVGILRDDERVELLDGEIVEMPPIGSHHFAVVNRLDVLLKARLVSRAMVSIQGPVTLRPDSEPQPDVTVCRLKEDFYESGLPEPQDTYLLAEVSDATLVVDRSLKVPRYARAGIPEVWVVDLQGRRVEVHRSPSLDGYREVSVTRPGDHIAPLAFPDVSLSVDEMFTSHTG